MPSDQLPESFTIRWDVGMGCYRASVPNLEGPVEVVPKARCDFTHARDMEYIRAKDAEVERLRGLLEQVDAHYSGSLDHQPGYVKRIRALLAEPHDHGGPHE